MSGLGLVKFEGEFYVVSNSDKFNYYGERACKFY